ncbi:hypothetical protein WJ45_20140 [Burkholderia ubonensis]|nr:hypothetical protein WJ45_20140 [Burkholderia ubonensis]KVQ44356.1 hypothetical protein WK04_15645 [Burkholderia ubonensis]
MNMFGLLISESRQLLSKWHFAMDEIRSVSGCIQYNPKEIELRLNNVFQDFLLRARTDLLWFFPRIQHLRR